MGIWSKTKLSSVVASGRIDADYYSPKYIDNECTISMLSSKPIHQFYNISDGNHLSISRHFVSENGVPYYRGQDINDFFIDNSSPMYIPENIFSSPIMQRSHFRGGDVLLSIVGTIGSLSLLPFSFTEATGSCKIAILKSKKEYSGAFLSAFLLSKYGQLQIHRNTRGTVQMGLILKDVSRIKIPFFTEHQREIVDNLIYKAISSNSSSRELIEKAKYFLESELGLDKFNFLKPPGYSVKLSDIELSRRFDPERFYPAFNSFHNHLPSGVKLTRLSSHLNFCQRGKQPIYKAHGLPVINSKHVQPNRVIIDGNRNAIKNPIYELNIRHGDILLNGTGRGTLGRAAPYLEESSAVPDNHVTILRSPNLDPVYVSLYLNSRAGQMQVEMHQRGTSGQLELYPFDIRKFLIWEAPEGLQKELRSLYDRAAAAERESKELLEAAKTRVEQLIEEAART